MTISDFITRCSLFYELMLYENIKTILYFGLQATQWGSKWLCEQTTKGCVSKYTGGGLS